MFIGKRKADIKEIHEERPDYQLIIRRLLFNHSYSIPSVLISKIYFFKVVLENVIFLFLQTRTTIIFVT